LVEPPGPAASPVPTSPADAAARYLRAGTLSLRALPPLSVYVHLPWCLKKCPYCDFNSHELRPGPPTIPIVASAAGSAAAHRLDAALEQRYLDAVCADLDAALPLVWGRRVHSVFIGGGTPSLFSPGAIGRLIGDLRARLPLGPGCEITLEANPGTFERDRFRGFADAGVTRLSIGVQSFDDAALQRIGRVHDGAQARAAVAEAAQAFTTFNLDLMYALPGQDLAALHRDLDVALGFAPPHLSIYHLTIEPNTLFAHRPPVLPDDDTASVMLDAIADRTAAAGLQRYEVSAFARDGHRCAHNLNYWRFGDYLGLGAGAHGKLSFPHRIVRQVRWREPMTYIERALAGAAVSNEEEVGRKALPFEFMLNALRLADGVPLASFVERTGLPLSAIDATLDRAVAQGLLERHGDAADEWVRPTARGFDFLSDLQAMFLAD
jgi:putative oxygen-independent coproporphyrinogen III oxidase